MSELFLLARVRAALEQIQDLDFVVPEETGRFSIDDEHVHRVRPFLAECITILREASEYYESESQARHRESEGADGEDDFLREIGAQISTELAARELSDLAFISRSQLVEIRDSLDSALEERQIWAVASAASAAVRRCGRALIAVETAVCEFEGLESPQRRWVDLADSLAIRRHYAKLRRAILRRDASDAPLEDKLKGAVRRISILRKLDLYPYLRIEDRRVIKRLQERIHGWLQADPRSDEDGLRLWQDLVSFAGLLGSINDREELREHDRQLLRTLHRRLLARNLARPPVLTRTLREEVSRLEGLDDDLDKVLGELEGQSAEALREPFERLLAKLDRHSQNDAFGADLGLS